MISLDDLGDPYGKFLSSSLSYLPFQSFVVFVKLHKGEAGNASLVHGLCTDLCTIWDVERCDEHARGWEVSESQVLPGTLLDNRAVTRR